MTIENKQTPQQEHLEIKTKYDEYNVSKYTKWATGLDKSTEQTKFEEYLKTVEPNKMMIVKPTSINKAKYNELVTKATSNRQTIYIEEDTRYKNLVSGDNIIIPFKAGWVTDKLDTTFNIYGRVIKVSWELSKSIEFEGLGYSVGVDTMTTKEIEDYVQQHAAGGQSPTPSTPSNGINIRDYDREQYTSQGNKEEMGQYGLNLIDYRDIAKSPQLGLAGSHIKVKEQSIEGKTIQVKSDGFVIFNKYPHLNGSDINTKHYGGSVGISGIKKGVRLTIEDSWKPLPNTELNEEQKGQLILNLIKEDISGSEYKETQEPLQFNYLEESRTHDPSHHGRYQIELGTVAGDHNVANKYMLSFKARYGTLPTKSSKRTFEFKEHKGYTLRANGYGLQDEYYTHPMGDVLIRKVGHVKFTDLIWYHGLDIIGDKAHYIYAKVPEDCKLPTGTGDHSSQDTMVQLGKKLMTNNLTEITPATDEHIELLKFDKNPPYLEQVIVKLPYQSNKLIWCFLLITSPENAKRYHDLLSETEITYELADEYQKPIYLQQGGFDIVLNNGTVIHSNQYKKIEKKTDQNVYKLTDLAGNVTKININQIVETIGVE